MAAVRPSMQPMTPCPRVSGAPCISDERMMGALNVWATLIGQLSVELFGHLMNRIADDLGLP